MPPKINLERKYIFSSYTKNEEKGNAIEVNVLGQWLTDRQVAYYSRPTEHCTTYIVYR